MDLVTPSIGLIFWQIILFILLFFLLAKFAWKPILQMIEKRERYLQDSLETAQKAQIQMSSIEKERDNLIKQSRIERDLLFKEAKNLRDQMIHKAREDAKAERQELLLQAKNIIENQKKAALADVKNHMAALSIHIAEKLMQKELKEDKAQEKFISDSMADFKYAP